MAFDNCMIEIKEAAENLGEDELVQLLGNLSDRIKREQMEGIISGSADEIAKIADKYARELEEFAIIEKRNSALNFLRRKDNFDYITENWQKDIFKGLDARLTGVQSDIAGSRRSAASEQNQLSQWYKAGLVSDITKAGHLELFRKGVLDREISQDLWALTDNNATGSGNKSAKEIAEIIHSWQSVAKNDANAAGAWIKDLPGWIVAQSHDMHKIRKVGREQWKNEVRDILDPKTFDRQREELASLRMGISSLEASLENIRKARDELKGVKGKSEQRAALRESASEKKGRIAQLKQMEKTMDDAVDPEVFLNNVYDSLASGIHLKTTGETGFRGLRNIGKSMSAERVLFFKSADDWFNYNAKFGMGNLRESLYQGLDRQAFNTGLMRVWGPNAEENLKSTIDMLNRDPRVSAKQRDRLKNKSRVIQNLWAELDGSPNIPGNMMLAKWASITRALQTFAKLGSATVSAASDIPIAASELRYQGKGFLSSQNELMAGLLKGRGTDEQREILAFIGVSMDGISGDVIARFSARDDLPGAFSRGVQRFFKINALQWWTDTMRATVALAMSNNLAINRNMTYANLNADLKRSLSLYDIGEAEWTVLRKNAVRTTEDGKEFMVPEGIREMTDTDVRITTGLEMTDFKVKQFKSQLEDKFRSFISDRTEHAVIRPDQKTNAIMHQGLSRGTPLREALDFVMQFKSFPIAVLQKAVGRELYGGGSRMGLFNLIAGTTVFGYIAMSAKDILKGREPRDPTEFKTIMAAMTQGGGAGIYGDFLFSEHTRNRFGSSAIGTMMGPTFGTANDVIDLGIRLREGDKVAAKALRLLYTNAPGANLFYTKWATDYLILYNMMEMIQPGYLKRMERRIEKDYGQKFIAPPSEVLR